MTVNSVKNVKDVNALRWEGGRQDPRLSSIIEECLLGVFSGHDYATIGHRAAQARDLFQLDEYNHGIVIAELLRNYHVYLRGRPPTRGPSLPPLRAELEPKRKERKRRKRR